LKDWGSGKSENNYGAASWSPFFYLFFNAKTPRRKERVHSKVFPLRLRASALKTGLGILDRLTSLYIRVYSWLTRRLFVFLGGWQLS
jgi:hypothetical protein